jgi:hypothetical protein
MPDNIQMPVAPAAVQGLPSLRGLLPDLIVDAGLPAIAYQILSRHGVAAVPALSAGAIFPAANILRKFVEKRTVDLIGAIVLFFLAVGVITSLISGSVLFILIKESFITGLVGLLFLSSFLWKRPIIFYFARQLGGGDDAQRQAYWDDLWEQRAPFRHTMRTMTLVWGLGYVIEAILRVIIALTFTPGIVVVVSPIMAIGTTIALILWTRSYGRAAYERGQREAALAQAAAS